jgi:electron transport complex protein RnfD
MVDKELQLTVSPSPHLRSPDKVSTAMRDVIIAMVPVTLMSIYWYTWNALFLLAVCLVAAVLTELIFRKVMNKKPTLYDGSALVTGWLVALCFTPGTAWWSAAVATFIAVGIAKELMGGLGWNRFNPALFGRVAVIMLIPLFSYLSQIFSSLRPFLGGIDATTQATPLALLKQAAVTGAPMEISLGSLFLGHSGGALGETSALCVLLGGAYLLYRRHISWHIPVSFIGAVLVMSLVFGPARLALHHVLAGGVMLGAFFMATDWVTSPITPRGQVIFGVAIGILVMIFRLGLGPTEGVAFSILIMNAFVPLIDRLTKRPKFGEVPVQQPAQAPAQPAAQKSS